MGDTVELYIDNELDFTGKINYGQFKDEFTNKYLTGYYLSSIGKFNKTYKIEDNYIIKKI